MLSPEGNLLKNRSPVNAGSLALQSQQVVYNAETHTSFFGWCFVAFYARFFSPVSALNADIFCHLFGDDVQQTHSRVSIVQWVNMLIQI